MIFSKTLELAKGEIGTLSDGKKAYFLTFLDSYSGDTIRSMTSEQNYNSVLDNQGKTFVCTFDVSQRYSDERNSFYWSVRLKMVKVNA